MTEFSVAEFMISRYLLAARAAMLLPIVDAALRTMPFRRVCAWLPSIGDRPLYGGVKGPVPVAPRSVDPSEAPPPLVQDEARRIAAIVETVSAEWPWDGHCLRSALVAYVLMTRRGIPVRLVIGLERHDRLTAHAWLECSGEVLVGRASARGCVPLCSLGER